MRLSPLSRSYARQSVGNDAPPPSGEGSYEEPARSIAIRLLAGFLSSALLTSACHAQDNGKAKVSDVIEVWDGRLFEVAAVVEDVAVNAMKEAVEAQAAEKRKNQMVERLRPAMNIELAFIRRASEMTDEQRKAIAAEAETALLELAGQHKNILNGRVLLQVNGAFVQQQGGANRGDMQSVIRQAARSAAENNLTKEQVAKLKVEWDYRDEAEKLAMIDDVVSQIDHQLRLSQEQYDNLRASFTSKWEHSVSIRFNSGQVFTVPAVPDELVLPFLNDAQKAVWELANKSASYTNFNQSRVFFDEPLWEDPEETDNETKVEANKDEAKKAAGVKKQFARKADMVAGAQVEAARLVVELEAAVLKEAELNAQQKAQAALAVVRAKQAAEQAQAAAKAAADAEANQ